MTGAELAAEMTVLRPGMPIILCTGFGQKISVEEAEKLGMHGVLKKPISKNELAQTVRRVLDRKD
jgi:FixJ family two-component response regulator